MPRNTVMDDHPYPAANCPTALAPPSGAIPSRHPRQVSASIDTTAGPALDFGLAHGSGIRPITLEGHSPRRVTEFGGSVYGGGYRAMARRAWPRTVRAGVLR